MTESDLLFAVAVLEAPASGRLEYDDGHPVMRERAVLNARYQELKRGHSFTDASRLARAEWLGNFLAKRGDEKPPPGIDLGGGSSRTAQPLSVTGAVSPPAEGSQPGGNQWVGLSPGSAARL